MAVAQGKHRSLGSLPAVAHRLLSGLPCQIRLNEQGWKATIRVARSGFLWSGPGVPARSATVSRHWYGR